MNLEFITNFINNKIALNDQFISVSFYELRIKNNFTEEEVNLFLNFASIRLKNLKYKVYFTGQEYEYKDCIKTVGQNELMIAIKEE